jgi:DNA processing protein
MSHIAGAGGIEPSAVPSTQVESLDFVALSMLPIRQRRAIGEHLRAGESPSAVLDRLVEETRGVDTEHAGRMRASAAKILAHSSRLGLTLVVWTDEAYPPALAAIVDPPPVLWIRGTIGALHNPAVAIVGSRAASSYALDVAERLAGDLAVRGVTVVSGLARGVDSAAHRGALSTSGSTIAVLGCGADIVYPPEHAGLARDIEGKGLIVSELVAGTRPLPHFFPLRNRIISGLSRAVVIVEAGERSGSLITARCALDQGRDVLAVPGNVLSGRNRGGHALLRDGAKIVETADDILEELGLPPAGAAGAPAAGRARAAAADPLLACLPAGEACDLDQISERSGLLPARLLPRLLELELRGLVRRAGAGRFVGLTERARVR